MPNKYVDEFYNLNCCPEILEIVKPVQNLNKEITESMAMIKQLRKIVLKNKQYNYQIYDFCAGNALTSIIASFLFKNVHCYAIDIRPRKRDWNKVANFEYINSDIKKDDWSHKIAMLRVNFPLTKTIIMSVHPCRDLAERIVSIYNLSKSDYMVLMPCCNGKTQGYSLPEVLLAKIGKYMMWTLYLQNKIHNKNSKLYIDKFCISPKNAIILSGL